MAPVSVVLSGKVGTTGGAHPSALREAVLDFDRNITLDARGLPVCNPPGGRDFRRRLNLRKICRRAIVGTGRADFELAFPELEPIREPSPLTVFNRGVRGGVTTLVAVASLDTPVPATIAVPIEITHTGRKSKGPHAVAKLPAIAGGSGSLLDFKLRLGRFFSYRGTRRSLLSARCPTGKLTVETNRLLFRNEAKAPGVASTTVFKGGFAIPCGPAR